MPYIYSYTLKNSTNRKNTNLSEYSNAIERALLSVFLERIVNTSVYRTYFEFTLTNAATDSELRQMGKKIAEEEPKLNDLKKDYGYSTQLLKRINYDIVIKDKANENVAIVEVKSMSKDVEIRKTFRNMIAHNLIPSSKYFILITQTYGYLWRNQSALNIDSPFLQFSMDDIINRYLSNEKSFNLRHDELELLLIQWLNEISNDILDKNQFCNAEKLLLEDGFIKDIHNSTIMSEVEL